jgi:hypothetical protein
MTDNRWKFDFSVSDLKDFILKIIVVKPEPVPATSDPESLFP